MKQHFMLGGQYFGSGDRDTVFVHAQEQDPTGIAFFCCSCGLVWAKAPIEGKPTYPLIRPCSLHGSTFFDHAGSMYIWWDSAYNGALPKALIQREFSLALEHYERYCKDTPRTEGSPDGRQRLREDV